MRGEAEGGRSGLGSGLGMIGGGRGSRLTPPARHEVAERVDDMGPLHDEGAIYYPPAFDRYAQQVLAAGIKQPVVAPDQDAARFGCNAVVVDQHVVLNAGCETLKARLEVAGYTVHDLGAMSRW